MWSVEGRGAPRYRSANDPIVIDFPREIFRHYSFFTLLKVRRACASEGKERLTIAREHQSGPTLSTVLRLSYSSIRFQLLYAIEQEG